MKIAKNKLINRQFAGCIAFILLIMAGISFTNCHNDIMEEWWYDKDKQKSSDAEPDSKPIEQNPDKGDGGGGSGANFGVVRFVLDFEPDSSKGEGPQPKEINVAWDDTIGRLRPITRLNYGFEGWLDEENQSWDVETKKVEKDTNGYAKADKDKDGYITLTAKWNKNVRTVSFNSGEFANDIPAQTVAHGGKVIQPVMPKPTNGKGFAGWYNNPGFTGSPWNFSTDTVTANMTLYAKWEDNACLVDFNANGGTRPDGVKQLTHTQSVAWGYAIQDPGPLVKLDASKKPQYSFAGWWTKDGTSDNNWGNKWNFADPVPSQTALTLHAKWELNKYTISFETPSFVPAIPDQEIEHGSSIIDPYAPPPGGPGPQIPDEYGNFDGWYTKDGTGGDWGDKWDFDNDKVTSNVKLYPRWGFAVTFKPYVTPSNVLLLPDGAVTIPPASVDRGAKVEKPNDPPKLDDGREFDGWYTKNGTGGDWGEQWDFSKGTVSENFTLYGKFTHKTRTVIFMPNGATMPKTTYSIAIGSLITNPGNPSRPGYGFLGWYSNPEFTPSSKVTIAASKVLAPDIVEGMDNFYIYANWSLTANYITFYVVDNGGNVIFEETQTYNYGDRILKAPTVPAELNCQLDGWYLEDGAKDGGNTWASITKWDFNTSIVKESYDLYARWVTAPHTITFVYGSPAGGVPGNFPNAADLIQYVQNNGTATEPFMPPSPSGKANFVAWYDGATEFDFSTPITGNKTLTAKWVNDVAGMIWVPRGSFVFGDSNVSGKTQEYNAYPSKIVTLDGFFMGETPVTQQQWATGASLSKFKGTTRPVENVTWAQANTYATGSGNRLPNEEEWEYAAKGGHYGILTNNTYNMYSGSNTASEVAWFCDTVKTLSEKGTQPVKGKNANSLGIYDMSGNVAEWCADDLGGGKVIRGGSWSNNAGNVRSVMRNSQDPDKASWDVGFRIVCGPQTIY